MTATPNGGRVQQRRSAWRRLPARLQAALAVLPVATLLACSGSATRSDTGTGSAAGRAAGAAAALPVFHRDDMLWLERVTFGLDSVSVAEYRRLGRERYLDRQLASQDIAPPPIAAAIDSLEVTHADAQQLLIEVNTQNKAINAMPDGADKDQARKALNDRGNKLAYEAARRELLRAVY